MTRKHKKHGLFSTRKVNRSWTQTQNTAVFGSHMVIGIIVVVFMAVLSMHYKTGVNSMQAELQSEERRESELSEKLTRESVNWTQANAAVKETLTRYAIQMDRAKPYQIIAMTMPTTTGAGAGTRQSYAKTR